MKHDFKVFTSVKVKKKKELNKHPPSPVWPKLVLINFNEDQTKIKSYLTSTLCNWEHRDNPVIWIEGDDLHLNEGILTICYILSNVHQRVFRWTAGKICALNCEDQIRLWLVWRLRVTTYITTWHHSLHRLSHLVVKMVIRRLTFIGDYSGL